MKKFMFLHFGFEEPTPKVMKAWEITGHNVIEARSLREAEELAKTNPFVSSIRVYEIR